MLRNKWHNLTELKIISTPTIYTKYRRKINNIASNELTTFVHWIFSKFVHTSASVTRVACTIGAGWSAGVLAADRNTYFSCEPSSRLSVRRNEARSSGRGGEGGKAGGGGEGRRRRRCVRHTRLELGSELSERTEADGSQNTSIIFTLWSDRPRLVLREIPIQGRVCHATYEISDFTRLFRCN